MSKPSILQQFHKSKRTSYYNFSDHASNGFIYSHNQLNRTLNLHVSKIEKSLFEFNLSCQRSFYEQASRNFITYLKAAIQENKPITFDV
jgi:hypothetical protein